MSYADLEISLNRHQAELASYEVELRFSNPASEVEIMPVRGMLSLDPQEFLLLQPRPDDYGQALTASLFTDPDTGTPLATSEKMLLSRFGASQNWRTIRLRPKTEQRALVAVSAPSNLDEYELAAIDIDGEIERARENLKGI